MHLVTLTVTSTMSNFTTSHAVPSYDLQKMLRCQIQALWLKFYTCGPSCKQAGSKLSFIADDHLLPHLTIPPGVPPLDTSHRPLHECFAGPQT